MTLLQEQLIEVIKERYLICALPLLILLPLVYLRKLEQYRLHESRDQNTIIQRLSIIEYCVAYSAKNFAMSFFSNATKVKNTGLPMVRSQTD